MTPSEYGKWDLISTTVILLMPFLTFELVSATYRWLIVEESFDKRKKTITTGAVTIIRNLLVFNLLFIIINSQISLSYGWEILLLINVSIISSFMQQSARGLGFNKIFAISGILQTLIILILNIIFIFIFDLRLAALLYSSILSYVIVTIYIWLSIKIHIFIDIKHYSRSMLKSFLQYSLPLIPGAVSWWVMNASDRFIIAFFLGTDANGIYAISNKIPSLLTMVSSVFFLAWNDSAIRESNNQGKNEYYTEVFKHYFRLMTIFVIGIIVLIKPIMEIMVSDTFFVAWKYSGILIIGALFNTFSQFWGAGYYGSKQTKVLLWTSILGALINIFLNLLLINHLGLYAASLSTAIAFLFTWLMRVFNKSNNFKINICLKDFLVLSFFLIIALGLLYVSNSIMIVIQFIFVIFLFTYYNKAILRLIYKKAIGMISSR
ncbi:hypothetical protein D3H55_06210 [Bacillus salacetis]|uniref:Uncharacterized protein n=1 Tax=Bacillus salacetis TaxID=2315464 RepID=A0A3A1R578_9BACI|nr:hypothetical protein D3H55_06210 [Bacillus salacetis]